MTENAELDLWRAGIYKENRINRNWLLLSSHFIADPAVLIVANGWIEPLILWAFMAEIAAPTLIALIRWR